MAGSGSRTRRRAPAPSSKSGCRAWKARTRAIPEVSAAPPIRPPLPRSASEQHHGNGAEEDLEVEPQRPLIDVGEVELHPGLEVDLVAAADLPDAGDAGPHREPAPLPALVLDH